MSAFGAGDSHNVLLLNLTTFLVDSPQLIHTISVVDRDEPQSGHRFFFTLAPEASSNPHFTLWDVKGEHPRAIMPPGTYVAVLMALAETTHRRKLVQHTWWQNGRGCKCRDICNEVSRSKVQMVEDF